MKLDSEAVDAPVLWGIKEDAKEVPQMYFVWLGHMVCFPSHYLSCLKHLHTGNKDSQGNVSCKSLRDVNGGLDKGNAGQVIQRPRTAGIVNFVCVCVCVFAAADKRSG